MSIESLSPLLGHLRTLQLTSEHALMMASQLKKATSLTRLVLRQSTMAGDKEAQSSMRSTVQPYLPEKCMVGFQ